MVVGGTTVGPLTSETRDRLAAFRDDQGLPNYDQAINTLLDAHTNDD